MGTTHDEGLGRLLRAGRRPRLPAADTLQLGADFVVNPEGRVACAYRSAGHVRGASRLPGGLTHGVSPGQIHEIGEEVVEFGRGETEGVV